MKWNDKIDSELLISMEDLEKLTDRSSLLRLLSRATDIRVCELGVSEGVHFRAIKDIVKPALLIGIDTWDDDGIPNSIRPSPPWSNSNHPGYPASEGDCRKPGGCQDGFYHGLLRSYLQDPDVRLIRDNTRAVFSLFPDGFFDLVYIDADHSFENCLKDMQNWYPKVKRGALMVGDDYCREFPGVMEAVSYFLKHQYIRLFHSYSNQWLIIR